MPLQLLPLEESDMYDYISTFAESFKDELMAIMYPNGYFEEDKQVGIDFQLKEWRRHPEILKLMKVIDTDLPEDAPFGKIVGVSKWKFYPRDRTDEELEEEAQEFKDRTLPPNANKAFFEEFVETIGRCKKEIVGGKAHALLGVLATLPNHHRRGIGAMHINWGLEQADKLGVQAYVEASPMGRPLYERYGFEEVMPFPLDAKKWGLDHDLPHSCMIRPSRQANGTAA